MKRCQGMVNVGRRRFLSGASVAAAGVAAATVAIPQAKAAPAPARVNYPSNRLANVNDLKLNEPLNVSYPDNDAPGVLLKLGKRVANGKAPTAISSASPQSARTRGFRFHTITPTAP